MATALYHGGRPGLFLGDLIVPYSAAEDIRANVKRMYGADRVHITPDIPFALFTALWHWDAVELYEVEPIGPLEIDPDFARAPGYWGFVGVSEMQLCEKAKVVGITRLPPDLIAHALQSVTRAIPLMGGSLAPQAQRERGTPEQIEARDARHKFEKKQRKRAQRARKRGK